ncbi:MAG: hypothetical protein AAF939_10040 [Planctomycetota bacterium]
MTWGQFVALLKLRIRLSLNQAKKGGKFAYYLTAGLMLIGFLFSTTSLILGFAGGLAFLEGAGFEKVLVSWTIVGCVFLLFWTIGLLTELQQSELLSMDRLLHLPISLKGVFFLNYSSCLLNISFLMFAPGMLGFAVAMIYLQGIKLLLSIPLVIGFLFLVSAITYHFRGWVGRLMENKKYRGNVIVIMTLIFVLLAQVPMMYMRGVEKQGRQSRKQVDQTSANRLKSLRRFNQIAFENDAISIDAKLALDDAVISKNKEIREAEIRDIRDRRKARMTQQMKTICTWFPLGWLPLGIAYLTEGIVTLPLIFITVLFTAGIVSLSYAYRSTLNRYLVGDQTGSNRRKSDTPKIDNLDSLSVKKLDFMYRRIPWIPDSASVVAFSSFRALVRSPEAKLILVLPSVLLVLFFGSSFFAKESISRITISESLRPWAGVGSVAGVMFMLSSFMFNMFGLDRDGFRAFVVTPIQRKHLLLGKNLSMAPLGFGLSLGFILILTFIAPVGPFKVLAVLMQVPTIFLLFCLIGNYFSIGFPMGIKRGTMQPSNPRILYIILISIVMAISMSLILIPSTMVFGVSWLVEFVTQQDVGWLYLVLSVFEFAIVAAVYDRMLDQQAQWLWKRESDILLEVANVPE